VLVGSGIALLSILSFAVLDGWLFAFKRELHYAMRSDWKSLQDYIENRFNCSATVPARPAACATNGWIVLQSRDPMNPVLVDVPTLTFNTRVGPFLLRARCEPCATCPNLARIVLEATSRSAGGLTRIDPITKQAIDWRDLYYDVPVGGQTNAISGCVVPP
jgi:hypothetical protein